MFDPYQLADWKILSLEWTVIVALAVTFALVRRTPLALPLSTAKISLLANEMRPLAVVFTLALLTGAVTSAIRPAWPVTHDEYSYLLSADTFAHGRVTNPVHPFWPHFETFHVLQRPSYQSRFPPAQGLFLAVGQALSGEPIVGVWLSLALACAALYWCLRGFAPRAWAFFGATLPCIRFGSGFFVHHEFWAYWGASYWGGAVAFLGGCLALGATPRLLRKPRTRDSLLLGLGFGVLAASRPFEGLVLAGLISLLLLVGFSQKRRRATAVRGLAPAASVALLCLGALLFYNWRVTGSPLTAPYTLYADTYDVVPLFTFQKLRAEPEYRHEVLRQFHLGVMVKDFQYQQRGPLVHIENLRLLGGFFLGPSLLLVALLGLCWRSGWLFFVLLTLAVALYSHAITLSSMYRPHYFAPFAPALALLSVQGLRVLSTLRLRSFAIGVPLARAVAMSCVLVFAASAMMRIQGQWPKMGRWNRLEVGRRWVTTQLAAEGPKHLVFVRYGPKHSVDREWVYNLSDIDNAPVIWAREMSPPENRALREYYADRQSWTVEPDTRPIRLLPFE